MNCHVYKLHADNSDDNFVWFRSETFTPYIMNYSWIAIHKNELTKIKYNPIKWASLHLQSNNFNHRNLSNAIINNWVEL